MILVINDMLYTPDQLYSPMFQPLLVSTLGLKIKYKRQMTVYYFLKYIPYMLISINANLRFEKIFALHITLQ